MRFVHLIKCGITCHAMSALNQDAYNALISHFFTIFQFPLHFPLQTVT